MSNHSVSFNVSMKITVEERDGWFYGRSCCGREANSNSELDCVRKLKDEAMSRVDSFFLDGHTFRSISLKFFRSSEFIGRAMSTQKLHRNTFNLLANSNYLDKGMVTELPLEEWSVDLVQHLIDENLSPASLARSINNLISIVFKWAIFHQLTNQNPALKTVLPSKKKPTKNLEQKTCTGEFIQSSDFDWLVLNFDSIDLSKSDVRHYAQSFSPASVTPWIAVYFLLVDDLIVYVGKSVKARSRLNSHRSSKPFNRFFCLEGVPESLLDQVESYYINKFTPMLNGKSSTLCEFLKEKI